MTLKEMDGYEVPEFVDECLWDVYEGLYRGVRDEEDPVTVRTLLVDSGRMLGLNQPEWERVPEVDLEKASQLLGGLLVDTHLAPLMPEFLTALGVAMESEPSPLELLVVNGRHTAEPLWGSLTRYSGTIVGADRVAAFNPVGHYNDHQPRVAGLAKLLRPVRELAIVASTQTAKGGSLEVLSQTIRILRDPDFAMKIGRVNVVLPMFGGSRGHRLGQREGLVYEVMEMLANPKMLGFALLDVKRKVEEEFAQRRLREVFPTVRFLSVDIHNDELPADTFQRMGFEFVSVDPSLELVGEVVKELENNNLVGERLRVVACDAGAVPRTLRMAERLVKDLGYLGEVEVVYIDKKRVTAGKVADARLSVVERVWWDGSAGELRREVLDLKDYAFDSSAVQIYCDDMLDTGGTAGVDDDLLAAHFTNTQHKIFVATHAVLSKGLGALDKINADVFIVANTLQPDGLANRHDVRIVDVAPAIYRALFTD